MITSDQNENYLENPNLCPHCQSENIVAGELSVSCTNVYRDVDCKNCGETWTETFELKEISS
jgi:transcription elongation factor Elf1